MLRYCSLFIFLLLAACAGTSSGDGAVLIATAENGQPIDGANCSVTNNAQRWDIVTPATLTIGAADGELHIICNKDGYRSSELRISPAAGAPSGPGINLGLGGAGSAVGAGLGFSLPFGQTSRGQYPSTITVSITRQ